jgi:hypothetical protein
LGVELEKRGAPAVVATDLEEALDSRVRRVGITTERAGVTRDL